MFRGWLSIVFLLVVSILWTRPFKRKSVHRISLFIVLYADLLLLLQYIYCMMHTADELPFKDKGQFWIFANLAQIGIVRYDVFPCIPLLFKAICTLTFCFTLRQEWLSIEQKRASVRNLPSFQMSFEEKPTIWNSFHFGVNCLSHIWVLMVLLTMFIYSIYGYDVNLMKLCYMIYVLVFIIIYQLSLRVWRKMTYALWMLVIVSSMGNLIMIYTYQFDTFDYMWQHYFGIDKHM